MRLSSRAFFSYTPILVAALIAGAVYLLVAVRFGQPLRDAKEAIAQANNAHERLPSYVEFAVKRQVGPGINPEEIAKLRDTVAELTVELDKLRRANARDTSATSLTLRELGDANRSTAPGRTQTATAPRATVLASPAPEHQAATPAVEPPAPSVPAAAPPAPPKAIAVSRDGPMQMELVGHRVTSRGIVLDFLLTRTSGGDTAMNLSGPNILAGVKIVTSDGYELAKGGIVPPSSTSTRPYITVGLIEGAPIRLTYVFEGKFNGQVLCSKIELRATHPSNNSRFAFRFSDLLVSPE